MASAATVDLGFSATHGGTVTVNSTGTVTGGGAGSGGGNTALGGEGIHGNNLTVVNSGSISGGLNADGTRANAVTFTGGTNVYELRAPEARPATWSIRPTTAHSSWAVQRTAGFDASAIGAASQYQGFNTFEKTGTSIWTLNNTGEPGNQLDDYRRHVVAGCGCQPRLDEHCHCQRRNVRHQFLRREPDHRRVVRPCGQHGESGREHADDRR